MGDLNLETITTDAYYAIQKLDGSFVGTDDYIGVAWFWHYEHRHYLRSASYHQRRKVHNAFRKDNLAVDGDSQAHRQIVKRWIK